MKKWLLVGAVVVALLIIGGLAGYFISQPRGGETITIRISAEEQRINEKLLRGEPLTPAEARYMKEQIEKALKEGWGVAGGQPSQPRAAQSTPTATPTPEKATPTPETGALVFTKAPKNPKTPAEVVAAFYFLCNQGKYEEAVKFIHGYDTAPPESVKRALESLKTGIETNVFKGRNLERVSIYRVEPKIDNRVSIDGVLYFIDGNEEGFCGIPVKKIGGKWMIAD